MAEKCKILIANAGQVFKPQYGESVVLRSIALLLSRRGYKVNCLSMGNSSESIKFGNYSERVVPADFKLGNDFESQGSLKALFEKFVSDRENANSNLEFRKALEESKPDVVITTNFMLPHVVDLLPVLTEYKRKQEELRIVVVSNEFQAVYDFLRAAKRLLGDKEKLEKTEAKIADFSKNCYDLLAKNADAIVYYTDKDRRRAIARYPGYASKMNCIQPPLKIGRINSVKKKDVCLTVMFSGNFRHIQNKLAAENIRKKIAPKVPNVKFILVGPDAPRYASSNITSIGSFDKIDEITKGSDIFIVPVSHDTGILTKLFRPIQTGVPIISTPDAAEGYPAKHMRNMIVEPRIDKFPRWIHLLEKDTALRSMLAKNAVNDMRAYFSDDTVGKRWDVLFRQIRKARASETG